MGYFDAIYAAELPHRDVAVYMYLKHRANTEGRCWPSVRTIAKDLPLSRVTVQRALRELQQGGWIVAEPCWRENGSCTSNVYRLLQRLEKSEALRKGSSSLFFRPEDIITRPQEVTAWGKPTNHIYYSGPLC